nr:hypothetical protein [Corynebacterium pseudotuberculosis]
MEPQWRNHSDYRLYTEEDLTKAFTILVYREAGLSLKPSKTFWRSRPRKKNTFRGN